MENRPSNPPIKTTAARVNPPESQPEKKAPKPAPTAPTKPMTQKVTNPTKPAVNAPVKPMPSKMDDRLSDEDCNHAVFLLDLHGFFSLLASPESDPPAPAQAQLELLERRTSDTVLSN